MMNRESLYMPKTKEVAPEIYLQVAFSLVHSWVGIWAVDHGLTAKVPGRHISPFRIVRPVSGTAVAPTEAFKTKSRSCSRSVRQTPAPALSHIVLSGKL